MLLAKVHSVPSELGGLIHTISFYCTSVTSGNLQEEEPDMLRGFLSSCRFARAKLDREHILTEK